MTYDLIWSNGHIVSQESLRISASDRAFEHGLGLFETFRTWNGHASTLTLNLGRLRRSAQFWNIVLDETSLPNHDAIQSLLSANGFQGDAVLRLTASGGSRTASVVWLQAKPLPPAFPPQGLTLIVSEQLISQGNPTSTHKSLNYLNRRVAHDEAISQGAHEALLTSPHRQVWEGSRSNIFAINKNKLLTPSAQGPLLRGVARDLVIRVAESLGLECEETAITLVDLELMDEIFLTNAVRGVMPVACLRSFVRGAPGPWTCRISETLSNWLNSGRTSSWDW